MDRREFLIAGAAGAMAAGVGPGRALGDANSTAAAKGAWVADSRFAPPCGLYCGTCTDRANGQCHGCGCSCGRCAGAWHAEHCAIAECAAKRKVASCGDCADFACTKLIQFTNDPIWRTHLPCIENLRRRKAVGAATWIAEQQEYWSDAKRLAAWDAMKAECARKAKESRPG